MSSNRAMRRGFAEFDERARDASGEVRERVRSTVDDVSSGVRRVAKQTADYAKHGADYARQGVDYARHGVDEAEEWASEVGSSVAERVRDRPFVALLAAGTAGMIIAFLLMSGRAR